MITPVHRLRLRRDRQGSRVADAQTQTPIATSNTHNRSAPHGVVCGPCVRRRNSPAKPMITATMTRTCGKVPSALEEFRWLIRIAGEGAATGRVVGFARCPRSRGWRGHRRPLSRGDHPTIILAYPHHRCRSFQCASMCFGRQQARQNRGVPELTDFSVVQGSAFTAYAIVATLERFLPPNAPFRGTPHLDQGARIDDAEPCR
jgi:hypothetical protein